MKNFLGEQNEGLAKSEWKITCELFAPYAPEGFPFCGSLSKRFPISRKIRICPTLSVLRQKFFFDSFSLFEDLLPCLKSFRWLLSIYFSIKSAALFQQNFHDVRRHCNLKNLILYHQVPLEGGGFKPKFSVN